MHSASLLIIIYTHGSVPFLDMHTARHPLSICGNENAIALPPKSFDVCAAYGASETRAGSIAATEASIWASKCMDVSVCVHREYYVGRQPYEI